MSKEETREEEGREIESVRKRSGEKEKKEERERERLVVILA